MFMFTFLSNANAKHVKFTLALAISFVLIFSLAITVSADAPQPVTESATESYALSERDAVTAERYARRMMESGMGFEGGDPGELLETALTAITKIVDIDENLYTNFSWNHWGGTVHLNWSSRDWNASISASVSAEGELMYFYRWEWTEQRQINQVMLAELTRAQAADKAGAFLKKALGDVFDGFELISTQLWYPSSNYSISYSLSKNGYTHTNYTVSVEVDKITGEIMSFWRNAPPAGALFEYQDASETITREEALAAYLENIGLDLVYTEHWNWETRELTVRPVYRLNNNRWNAYISAVDGSLVEIDWNVYLPGDFDGAITGEAVAVGEAVEDMAGYGALNMGGMEQRARRDFSPAERAAIDAAADWAVKTPEEAINAMIKAFDLEIDPDDYHLNWHLNNHWVNQRQHLWNINLNKSSDDWMIHEGYYAEIDARSGDIISYSYSFWDQSRWSRGIVIDEEPQSNLLYTHDEAKEIAIAKIKSLLPGRIDFDRHFEFIDRSHMGIVPLSDDDKLANYHFMFARKANGILFEANAVSVTLNNTTGAITGYYLSWFENVSFPAVTNIVTPEAALKTISDFVGYNKYYMSNGRTEDNSKINVSLIYRFDGNVMVDPFTGKLIDWNFEEPTRLDNTLPDYTDLDGHWAEEMVKTLADNGIFVWGGDTFDPDKAITRGEFFSYMRFYSNNSWLFSQISSGISSRWGWESIGSGFSDPDAGKVITRQEAMKILCEMAGYGDIGKHYQIFAYPFNADGIDEEYKGYVAILYALGLIRGDGNGNFNAKDDLTRAEAAQIAYNIVMAFQPKG
jgi:hypothetical protein